MKLYTAFLTCIACLVSSCTSMDHIDPDGSVTKVRGFGGKGIAKTDKIALAWNNEKSFYHGTVLVGALGASVASTVTAKAVEATNQMALQEATKQTVAKEATQQVTVQAGAGVVNTANQLNTAAELAPAAIVTPKGY